MFKKIFILGALITAAPFVSGQETRLSAPDAVQRQDAEFVSDYITPTRIILSKEA